MIKIKKKAIYKKNENKMNIVSDTIKARKIFSESKSKNLDFLLQKRFEWMNSFIEKDHIGIEVGSGTGFSKNYILNKNFKTSDFSSDDHIDIKNIDAHSTGLKNECYDYVISTNMIHHLAYPMKFFKEMHRILKKTSWRPKYNFDRGLEETIEWIKINKKSDLSDNYNI